MAIDLTKVQAESTIGTFLYFKSGSETTASKLCRIKDYPDLGGSPDMITTTDLECDTETQVIGVQKASSMEFTLNYNMDVYDAVAAKANTEGTYEVRFGDETGKSGIFTFTGQHTIYVTGGKVGDPREMKLTIARSSKITKGAAA